MPNYDKVEFSDVVEMLDFLKIPQADALLMPNSTICNGSDVSE